MECLFIFSAPSGSGKTTIVNHLLKKYPQLSFSISATSREKRDDEKDGVSYYFLTADDFKTRAEQGEFIEWEEVYANQYYGTLKSEVQRIWEKKKSVVFDVDVVGGLNIKKQYGDKAVAIFVKPPSIDHLRDRLRARGTEDEASFEKRIAKAEEELAFEPQFDLTIVNDKLADALKKAEEIIEEYLAK